LSIEWPVGLQCLAVRAWENRHSSTGDGAGGMALPLNGAHPSRN
jgi:hypothetical protein